MAAVRSGEPAALIVALIALADSWLHTNAMDVSFQVPASSIAIEGATAKAGLLAAAVDLRALLTQCPQGRKALQDFGFEPFLQNVE